MGHHEIESAEFASRAASDDEKAEAAKIKLAVPPPSDEKFVQYVGARSLTDVAVTRPSGGTGAPLGSYQASISAAQWRAAGFQTDGDHHWHVGNDWRIPASQFSKAQLDHLLTAGKDAPVVRFRLVTAKGDAVDH